MTPVLLKDDELEVARAEVEAVRDVLDQGDYRDLLDDLLVVLARGDAIEGRQADELDRLLTLALQSGRVRALYGPGGEQAALRAFRKLPTGSELTRSTKAVNEALASLRDRPLDRLTLDGRRAGCVHARGVDGRAPAHGQARPPGCAGGERRGVSAVRERVRDGIGYEPTGDGPVEGHRRSATT